MANMQPPVKSKAPVIIAAVIVMLLAMGGGCWAWASAAKAQYVKAVPAYETRARAAYDYFGGLKDRLTHGADIKRKFDETIASSPKEPKLLGMTLAPADKIKRVNDLTKALREFDTTYVTAASISDYSAKALDIMAGATGTISTPTDMKNMEAKFKTAKTALSKLVPPSELKDFHSKTLAGYDAATGDIDRALDALGKSQASTYTEAVQKLATDVKAIGASAASRELAGIFTTAYGKADTAYGNLQKALGVN
jgi:hypothetical protein